MPNLTKSELADLRDQINTFHQKGIEAAKWGIVYFINAGEGLRAVRKALPPRTFKPWLEENFEGGRTTAYKYLKLAEEKGKIHTLSVHRGEQIESMRKAFAVLGAYIEPESTTPITDIQPEKTTWDEKPVVMAKCLQCHEPFILEVDGIQLSETMFQCSECYQIEWGFWPPGQGREENPESPDTQAGPGAPQAKVTPGGSPVKRETTVGGSPAKREGGGKKSTTVGGTAKPKPSSTGRSQTRRLTKKSQDGVHVFDGEIEEIKSALLLFFSIKDYIYNTTIIKEAEILRSDFDECSLRLDKIFSRLITALESTNEVWMYPPTLEQVQAIAERQGITPQDAEIYYNARCDSNWHYGPQSIKPVHSVPHDLPGYLGRCRRGEAQSEARYQRTKAERQNAARETDLMTASQQYMTEEEYNASQNGETL